MGGKDTSQRSGDDADARPHVWIAEYFTPYDAYHHGVRELLMTKRTKYQSMTIADTGAYGRALFLDARVQTTEGDEKFYHEPLVHTPILLNGGAKSVLILGGADGGAAREALRWNCVERVVVVDIDADVVEGCRLHLSSIADGAFEDPRCQLIIGDALDFIDESTELFDVIVSDLTDPVEDDPILALFSIEHFQRVSKRLSPNGVISLQGGALSLVESRLFPKVCRTLSDVFVHVFPCQTFVPTYGSPLALALATKGEYNLPSPSEIDRILENSITGELEVLDGRGVHGLFAVPKCISKAISAQQKPIMSSETTCAKDRNVLT